MNRASLFAGLAVCLAVTVPGSAPLTAQSREELGAILNQPIAAERAETVSRVPLERFMGKFVLNAAMDGVERRFILDTGSPTMISQELADSLDLEIIGSNTGRDANGQPFTTQIALVKELTIGPTTFRKVPVMVADFSVSDPDGCFFDGGLIGSEIFPGHVWHIDADSDILLIAGSMDDLPDAGESALQSPLSNFGYPNPPVFSYAINGFSDRALFDTGHSSTIVLFDQIMKDSEVRDAVADGSLQKGRGSHGVSAAGVGAQSDLLRFKIDGYRFGESELARSEGTTRAAPPSLMGMGILRTHHVTLDYPGARMILTPRAEPSPEKPSPGFGLMARAGRVLVTQLYDGSPAKAAGLELGDEVTAIDDRVIDAKGAPCETTRWLIEDSPTRDARSLTILREGQVVNIELAAQ